LASGVCFKCGGTGKTKKGMPCPVCYFRANGGSCPLCTGKKMMYGKSKDFNESFD